MLEIRKAASQQMPTTQGSWRQPIVIMYNPMETPLAEYLGQVVYYLGTQVPSCALGGTVLLSRYLLPPKFDAPCAKAFFSFSVYQTFSLHQQHQHPEPRKALRISSSRDYSREMQRTSNAICLSNHPLRRSFTPKSRTPFPLCPSVRIRTLALYHHHQA